MLRSVCLSGDLSFAQAACRSEEKQEAARDSGYARIRWRTAHPVNLLLPIGVNGVQKPLRASVWGTATCLDMSLNFQPIVLRKM